jgi:tetratricopeptide (TPR) repeat protein
MLRSPWRIPGVTWLAAGAVAGMLSGRVNAAPQSAVGAALTSATSTIPSSTRRVTFTRDIAPLVFDRCSGCHHPEGPAPFSLLDYAAVRQRATQIATMTRTRLMPPWKAEPGYGEFLGQQPMSDAEIDLIRRWVEDGAVEGEPRDLPAVPDWSDGWQLGTPDLIVTPPQAYTLGAEGTDAFRVFVIPIPTVIARYIKGVEFRPGNSRVVHHANILLDRTARSRELNEHDSTLGERGLLAGSATYPSGHFLGWTPGLPDRLLPGALSWRLEPGTDLVVQLHMVPSGKPEVVQFSVGFYFSDEVPERSPGVLRLGHQNIDIAAGQRHYTVSDSFELPVDVDVLALKPHAHYRAREIRAFATLPDGSTRWLLSIKDWDFRWQHVYRYVAPVVLPKGSIIQSDVVYDNSADNPRNPQQPPQRVRWGPRSSDEMGDLWLQMLPRDDRDLALLNRDIQRKLIVEDAIGYEGLIEAEPGNIVLHDDVAGRYLQLGRLHEAAAHYETSIRLNPQSALGHFNLGATLMLAGRGEQAIAEFKESLRLDPGYAAAHNNIGNVLDRQGKLADALVHYRAALRLNPASAAAHNNIGFVMARRGDVAEAQSQFREALTIDPDSADAHYNMGLALERTGNMSEAVDHFRNALRIKPDWAAALSDLAWALATASTAMVRDPEEAVHLAERAAKITEGRNADTLDALAAAYAARHQFARALDTIREAIRLAPAASVPGMLERQELYKKNQPYQERTALPAAPSR